MYEAAVIGVSAGGFHALSAIIPSLPRTFPLPIAIVQHVDAHSHGYLTEHLRSVSAITVKEAEDKEALQHGTGYIAPAGYHLLIEADKTFSLSVDEKVNWCRPSIDLLFESAADTFGEALIGILLTGANSDGTEGLKAIKHQGGLAIVQDPATAQAPFMPKAAIAAVPVDYIADLKDIPGLLLRLCDGQYHGPN